MTATDVVWAGIDAGKASHHAAAIDASGKRLWSAKVASGQQQIEELVSRAVKAGGEVRWAVDMVSPSAALLLAVLLSSGQKVVYVPGRVVHGMAGVFRGEGKTGAKDARIIADTVRMRGDLTEQAQPAVRTRCQAALSRKWVSKRVCSPARTSGGSLPSRRRTT